jgi:hypothetical protein
MSDVVIVRRLERIDVVPAHLACVLQFKLPSCHATRVDLRNKPRLRPLAGKGKQKYCSC